MSRISLKFLLSNGLAGTMIGTGGNAIKELIEVSEARVTVSSITDVYPGTSERIALISGAPLAVQVAQSLIWDMIAANMRTKGDKTVSWSPRTANDLGREEDDDLVVTGKVSIPAAAGGLILGRGGASLKALAEESGARVQMNSKDESMFTQERILTISGTVDACDKCLAAIIDKLAEDTQASQYVYRGVTYNAQFNMFTPAFDNRGGRGGRGGRNDSSAAALPVDVTANTEITIQVPDSLVGNILGRQGSTMREIMSISGAKVAVSPRGTPSEGNNMRTVTITGTPAHAHTAHSLVTQKLQQPSQAPRQRRSNKNEQDA